MSRWPVIALSFKDAEGLTFESAAANLVSNVFSELDRFSFLADSNRLTFGTRHRIRQLLAIESLPHEQSLQLLRKSLAFLIDAVRQSFGRDVIVLIDEYDVPLINAILQKCINLAVSILLRTADSGIAKLFLHNNHDSFPKIFEYRP